MRTRYPLYRHPNLLPRTSFPNQKSCGSILPVVILEIALSLREDMLQPQNHWRGKERNLILFVSVSESHTMDIQPSTILSWLKQTIQVCYALQTLNLTSSEGEGSRHAHLRNLHHLLSGSNRLAQLSTCDLVVHSLASTWRGLLISSDRLDWVWVPGQRLEDLADVRGFLTITSPDVSCSGAPLFLRRRPLS